MRKIGIIAVLALLVTALAAVPALALTDFSNAPTGAHYRQGFGEPICTLNTATDTVTCTGTQIAGVGNTNATASLSLDIQADVVCRNPGNRNIVEPHSYTDTVTVSTGRLAPRNGTLVVPTLSASAPSPEQIDAAFQCPNPNWLDQVTAVNVTGFTYTLTFVGFTEPAITIRG